MARTPDHVFHEKHIREYILSLLDYWVVSQVSRRENTSFIERRSGRPLLLDSGSLPRKTSALFGASNRVGTCLFSRCVSQAEGARTTRGFELTDH